MPASGRRFLTIFAAALFACAIATTAASAKTVLGDTCLAATTFGGSGVQSAVSPGSNSYTAPSDGILTSWGTNFPGVPGYSGELSVLRPQATPNAYTVIAVTDNAMFTSGITEFPITIPVQAGDTISMTGSPSAVACGSSSATDQIRYNAVTTAPVVGSTATFASGPGSGVRMSLHANFELDGDHDGYGDETQDLCPISASVHAIACPNVKLAKYALAPTKKSVQVLVTSTAAAPVTISGSTSIKLPKSGKKKAHTTKFKVASATTTVTPGTISTITVKLPSSLVKALKLFPKSKKFTLSLTITGVGVANTDTSKLSVKLPGTK